MYPSESYFTLLSRLPEAGQMEWLTRRVFPAVFRCDFDQPGFALIRLEASVSSVELRRFMVEFKQQFGQIYQTERERYLVYRSMLRFDQQATTRFHLDGAPDESYLMLGYEPSEVTSELAMADYSRAAYDLDLTLKQFLAQFSSDESGLTDYITYLREFDSGYPHLLLVNNSRLPYNPQERNSLGVMHQATILSPQPNKSRVINSTMLTSAANLSEELISESEQQEFVYK